MIGRPEPAPRNVERIASALFGADVTEIEADENGEVRYPSVTRGIGLRNGKGYAVLDTYPQGGAPTDARTQIAELAEYYLVADARQTFIMFNGGYAPATAWSQHWTKAVNTNVGQAQGAYFSARP